MDPNTYMSIQAANDTTVRLDTPKREASSRSPLRRIKPEPSLGSPLRLVKPESSCRSPLRVVKTEDGGVGFNREPTGFNPTPGFLDTPTFDDMEESQVIDLVSTDTDDYMPTTTR